MIRRLQTLFSSYLQIFEVSDLLLQERSFGIIFDKERYLLHIKRSEAASIASVISLEQLDAARSHPDKLHLNNIINAKYYEGLNELFDKALGSNSFATDDEFKVYFKGGVFIVVVLLELSEIDESESFSVSNEKKESKFVHFVNIINEKNKNSTIKERAKSVFLSLGKSFHDTQYKAFAPGVRHVILISNQRSLERIERL